MSFITKDIENRLKYIVKNAPGGVVLSPRGSGKTTAIMNLAHDYLVDTGVPLMVGVPTEVDADRFKKEYKIKFPGDLSPVVGSVINGQASLFQTVLQNLNSSPMSITPILIDDITSINVGEINFKFSAATGVINDGEIGPGTYSVGYQYAKLSTDVSTPKEKLQEWKIKELKKEAAKAGIKPY